jgi:hypothetical protein
MPQRVPVSRVTTDDPTKPGGLQAKFEVKSCCTNLPIPPFFCDFLKAYATRLIKFGWTNLAVCKETKWAGQLLSMSA